ncbi:MAG: hypothetical protein ABI743_01470 [bacterium]
MFITSIGGMVTGLLVVLYPGVIWMIVDAWMAMKNPNLPGAPPGMGGSDGPPAPPTSPNRRPPVR